MLQHPLHQLGLGRKELVKRLLAHPQLTGDLVHRGFVEPKSCKFFPRLYDKALKMVVILAGNLAPLIGWFIAPARFTVGFAQFCHLETIKVFFVSNITSETRNVKMIFRILSKKKRLASRASAMHIAKYFQYTGMSCLLKRLTFSSSGNVFQTA
jgi:hypothetical protein